MSESPVNSRAMGGNVAVCGKETVLYIPTQEDMHELEKIKRMCLCTNKCLYTAYQREES